MITTQPEAVNDSEAKQNNLVDCLPLEMRDAKLRLTQSLQSSLDLRDTICHFKNCVKEIVEFSSLSYKNPEKRLDIKLGEEKVHSTKYTLRAKNYCLGEMVFTRAKKFTETELAALESFIGLLFFPLRNALLYREALDNSLTEPLTQVGNRAALELALTREFNLSKRDNKPLSILVIDIDHFKQINDSLGHQQGDKLLKHTARIIKDTLREVDQVFRFGGDEFVILLNDTELNQATPIADRILSTVVNTPFGDTDKRVDVTLSIGVAAYRKGDTRETLFERADEALYMSKRAGRNCVMIEDSCTRLKSVQLNS